MAPRATTVFASVANPPAPAFVGSVERLKELLKHAVRQPPNPALAHLIRRKAKLAALVAPGLRRVEASGAHALEIAPMHLRHLAVRLKLRYARKHEKEGPYSQVESAAASHGLHVLHGAEILGSA